MLIFKGTVLLITLRTFTEYGFANGIRYSLLEIVTRAIGVIAIFFTLVTFRSGTINQRNRILSAAVFFTIIICTLNGLKNFPWDSALSEELVRLLAVYAFYVLASRFTAIPAPAIRRYLLFACTLPGIIVLGTFLLGSEIFRSGSDRATGTFAHSNTAAAYLGVSAIVCIAIFFEVRNKLFLVFFLINVIAIGVTQSLTSLVGLVFAMAIIGLNNPKIKSSLKKTLVSLTLILTTIFFSLEYLPKIGQVFSTDYKLVLTTGETGTSIGWRLLNWTLYLEQWKESPVLGFGPGSASAHFSPLGSIPHSAFVQMLVEYGVLGLSVGLLSFIVFIWQNSRVKHREGLNFYVSLPLGSFLAILAMTSNIFSYTSALYLSAFTFGIMSQISVSGKSELERESK